MIELLEKHISEFSVLSAVVFFNIALILIYVLLRRTKFLASFTVSSLGLLTLLAALRLILPLDFEFSYIISSRRIFPAIISFFNSGLFNSPLTVGGLLLAVWGLGTAACVIYDLRRFAVAKKVERGYTYVTDREVERQAALLDLKYPVRVSPDIAEPYSVGIFKPCIYLPDWELSESELRFILRHEVQHIRSRDALKKLIFFIIEAVFWWNPIMHIFRRELNQLLEIQCDQRLTKDCGFDECAEYAGTLLSALKRVTRGRKNVLCSSGFSNSAENMKQRFELILSDRREKDRRAKALFNSLLIAAFILSYFLILQPVGEPPYEDIEGVLIITEDNSYILHDDGRYYLYYEGEFVAEVDESHLNDRKMKNLQIIEQN